MTRRRSHGAAVADAVPHRWIDDQAAFAEVVEALTGVERYAIDTEFHRERTYYPALALVQLAWDDELVLVDPLAVDVRALARVFESDAEAVFHAAQQDLDVLSHAVGSIPRRMFDTQIAAGFLGYGTPSLVALLQGELGVSPSKGDRLTDWLRRPLTEAQRSYAASDVAYLLATRDRLVAQLEERGRMAWVSDAIDELRDRPTGGPDLADAWRRLKDTRGLRPRSRAVAQSVAAWRERVARERNVPVRQVLPDLAVLGIAQRRPTTPAELAQARGVDDRLAHGSTGAAILDAVAAGRAQEPPAGGRRTDDLERELRPAVTLVSAWVAQLARQSEIDTAMLATRADLIDFLVGEPDARLASGWRAEMIGDDLARLVAGEAALTFDRSTGLRLVEVGRGD